jgi:type IV pilus assembly protein PilZ
MSEKENNKDQDKDNDNRRDNSRRAIELKVEYKKLNTFFYDYTKNISRGGTFIRTKKPLDVGTSFVFKLTVPTLDTPLVLKGEVKWIRHESDLPSPNPEEAESGMGIQFVYDDTITQEDVAKSVERLMVSSLGQRIYSRLHPEGDDSN